MTLEPTLLTFMPTPRTMEGPAPKMCLSLARRGRVPISDDSLSWSMWWMDMTNGQVAVGGRLRRSRLCQ